MENFKKVISAIFKFMLLLVFFSLFLFVGYYSVMSILSTSREINAINNTYNYNEIEKNSIDEKFFTDSTFVILQKEKAFFQSRLTMASTDSIGLTLNLQDSSASLEINGVVVHKVKISYISESKVFSKANSYAVATMLSKPLTKVNTYSTIKREPVMIKMAPKDTSEYKPDIIPDTSAYEPVNYILEMDNGVRIIVYQEERKKMSDVYDQIRFDLNDKLRNTYDALKSIKEFSIPAYHPFIKIRLPKADAKIIYRALPEKGQVVIYR